MKIVHKVWPACVTKAFNDIDTCRAALSAEKIGGLVWGKEGRHPSPRECRAILPLSSPLSVLDFMISHKLHAICVSIFRIPSSIFVGAGPGTQCLDIAFTAQQVIEKGNDDHGRGGCGTDGYQAVL